MKILIVQIGRIGDMILTTPMFRAIHQKFPDSEIHILASRKNFEITDGHSQIAKTLIFDKQPLQILPLLWQIRREKYDLWIDPKDHFSRESSLLAKLSGAKKKIGFNDEKNNVFDVQIPFGNKNENLHIAEINLRSLSVLGISGQQNLLPELTLKPDSVKFADDFLAEIGTKSKICVNISAGQTTRFWQKEQWKELISVLSQKKSGIILTFSPSDREIAEEIASVSSAVRLFPSRSISDVIALLKNVDLVISPDTSIVHIASAWNKPIVALFPNIGWNFSKFAPLSERQKVIMPEKTDAMIAEIESKPVIQAVEMMIDSLGTKS